MGKSRTALEILQEVSKKLEELAKLHDEFKKVTGENYPEFKVGFFGRKIIDISARAMVEIFPDCEVIKTKISGTYTLHKEVGGAIVTAFLDDSDRTCELPAVKALRKEIINEQIEELERKKAELMKGKGEN